MKAAWKKRISHICLIAALFAYKASTVEIFLLFECFDPRGRSAVVPYAARGPLIISIEESNGWLKTGKWWLLN